MKPPSEKVRVLVIDDSEVALQAISSVLEAAGLQVFTTESAVGAMNAIVKHDVHALVVDMNMPLMSGSKFGEVLRKNERLRHVKLVLVSGESEQELRRAGALLGADAVLTKSQIADQLAPTVLRLVSRGSFPGTSAQGTRELSTPKLRALVVDADRTISDECVRHLSALGFETEQRTLGKGILSTIIDARPSLVVVGEMLRDMPGVVLVELIDDSTHARSVPLVMFGAPTLSPGSSLPSLDVGPRARLRTTAIEDHFRDVVRRLVGLP